MGVNLCPRGAGRSILALGTLTAWGMRFHCGLPRFEFLETISC